MFGSCMAVVDPFAVMDTLDRSFFDLPYRGTREPSHTFGFGTDVTDEGDFFKLCADLPGFNKEDIHIDTKDNILTVSAERRDESEKSDKKGRYIHRERSYGSFQRTFDLSDVNADAISAQYENGVLTLILPKKAPKSSEGRQITID